MSETNSSNDKNINSISPDKNKESNNESINIINLFK